MMPVQSQQQSAPPREKLQWVSEETLRSGTVEAEITSATRDGRKLYSVRVGRVIKPGVFSGFFRPVDIPELIKVSEEAKFWIQADKAEREDTRKVRRA